MKFLKSYIRLSKHNRFKCCDFQFIISFCLSLFYQMKKIVWVLNQYESRFLIFKSYRITNSYKGRFSIGWVDS